MDVKGFEAHVQTLKTQDQPTADVFSRADAFHALGCMRASERAGV